MLRVTHSPSDQPHNGHTLSYDAVPVRPHVQRFDGGAKLVVPNQHVFARLLITEAMGFLFPAFCLIGATLLLAAPRLLNLNPPGQTVALVPAGLAAFTGVFVAGLQVMVLAIQARKAPPATVLVWDGDQLVVESAEFSLRNSGGGGSALASGDVQRWSRAALAYIEAEAINVIVPTHLSRIRIQSRFDFPCKLACYPSRDLAPAVAEFNEVIGNPASGDSQSASRSC